MKIALYLLAMLLVTIAYIALVNWWLERREILDVLSDIDPPGDVPFIDKSRYYTIAKTFREDEALMFWDAIRDITQARTKR